VFKQEGYPKWQQCYHPVSAQNKFYLKKNVKVYSKGSSRKKIAFGGDTFRFFRKRDECYNV